MKEMIQWDYRTRAGRPEVFLVHHWFDRTDELGTWVRLKAWFWRLLGD